MEKLIKEIEVYAKATGVLESTVLKRAAKLSGRTWKLWKAGKSTPTFKTAERIRKYIKDNPPEGK